MNHYISNIVASVLILMFSNYIVGQQVPVQEVTLQTALIEAKLEAAKGRPEKAIEKLNELYKEDRTNAAVALELAKNHLELKQFEMVDKFAKVAVENDSDNIWVQAFYSDFLLSQNRPEAAIAPLTKLLAIQPDDFDTYNRLIDTYIQIKKPKEGLAVTESMISRYGNNLPLQLKKFELLHMVNDDAAASEVIESLCNRYPSDIDLHKIKADFYLETRQQSLAFKTFEHILTLDPNDTDANLALLGERSQSDNENSYLRALLPVINNKSIPLEAKIKEIAPYVAKYATTKEPQLNGALKEVGDRLIQTHPDEGAAHAIYGDILIHAGNPEAAINQYEKALSINKKDFGVWEQLLYIYDQTDAYDKLLKLSSQAMDYFPNQPAPYMYKGLAAAAMQNYKEAKEWLEEAKLVAATNNAWQANIQASFAHLHTLQKQYDKAKDIVNKVLKESDGQHCLSLERSGDIAHAQGQKEKALDTWQKAEQCNSSSPRIITKVASLKGE